jgi:mycothiol synthase
MESLRMRRPTLADLPPLPSLPNSYTLRPMQELDMPAVADVLDRAFLDEGWDPGRVRTALWDEPSVSKTLLLDSGGQPVATASARLLPERFPGSGYLHWVAVDPAHTGHRFGKYISLAILHEFVALGCDDAVLETQDHRLPAIKTYLNLGFLPEYPDEAHRERWRLVGAALQNPLVDLPFPGQSLP